MIVRVFLLYIVLFCGLPTFCALGENRTDSPDAVRESQAPTAGSSNRLRLHEPFRFATPNEVLSENHDLHWPALGSILSHSEDPGPASTPSTFTTDSTLRPLPAHTQPDRTVAGQVSTAYFETPSAQGRPFSSDVQLISQELTDELPPPTPDDFRFMLDQADQADETDLRVTPQLSEEVIAPGGVLPELDEETFLALPARQPTELATRLGYWSVDQRGNPVKVGEWQSLESSVFLDFDGLHTDGATTLNFYGSVLDKDARSTGVQFFSPGLQADFFFQDYLRRLDRDPYSAFVDFDQQPDRPLPGPPGNYRDMKEDLTVGDDFAIRVEELDTSFSGRLTDHVNWRLNLWGMRKHGERQSAAFAHCFAAQNATDINGNPVGGNSCHVLIQNQRIDWLTAEIEPVIEACYGPVTIEYSRTMRSLTTDDQLMTRPYDRLGLTGDLPYDIVPENFTQIDRLKVGWTLPNHRHGYARLYSGETENRFRNTDRDFRGLDLRLTDQSIAGLTLTGFVQNYVQEGQLPSELLPQEDPTQLRPPINYNRTNAGFDTTWRPFLDDYSWWNRLRLGSGYEYREIDRGNAIFEERQVTADNSFTKSNHVHVRLSTNWTPLLESYVRYRISFIDNPLYAAPIGNTTVNTSLPTQLHSLRFGNTWSPAHNVFLHGLFGVNNGQNDSDIANFQQDRYDLVFTAWWAPNPCWTLSGGLGFYADWIDQDITLGSKTNPSTLPWEYGGRSDVINFGTTYAWTKQLTLSGTLDFVRGRNAFDPLTPWPDLWTYSDVNVETTRFGVGVDYDLTSNHALYFRYQLFDYDDRADSLVGGTADMFLFGGSAFF